MPNGNATSGGPGWKKRVFAGGLHAMFVDGDCPALDRADFTPVLTEPGQLMRVVRQVDADLRRESRRRPAGPARRRTPRRRAIRCRGSRRGRAGAARGDPDDPDPPGELAPKPRRDRRGAAA